MGGSLQLASPLPLSILCSPAISLLQDMAGLHTFAPTNTYNLPLFSPKGVTLFLSLGALLWEILMATDISTWSLQDMMHRRSFSAAVVMGRMRTTAPSPVWTR